MGPGFEVSQVPVLVFFECCEKRLLSQWSTWEGDGLTPRFPLRARRPRHSASAPCFAGRSTPHGKPVREAEPERSRLWRKDRAAIGSEKGNCCRCPRPGARAGRAAGPRAKLYPTDSEGRFRITALLAGRKFRLSDDERELNVGDGLRSGHTKDLGDVRLTAAKE